ncbi:MAG: 23S rRNA pseudouridine1911/1915/1917 synthase, partial [Myxococcota bacterium]
MSDTPDSEDSDLVDPAGVGAVEGLLRFVVEIENDGQRLDAFIAERADFARAQVRRWVERGDALLNDTKVRPSRKVAVGDVVTARVPEVQTFEMVAEEIPLVVLHEDTDIVVVDKVAGMVVHPAPGHMRGTLVNALLHACGSLAPAGGEMRPGIVHRLDRGTSGVMVVAKTDVAHAHLAEQFHDHTIDRLYRTFVRSLPGADMGVVDAPIGRHPQDRKKMSLRTESGRDALTKWRVLARYPDAGISLLEIRPESGRTHQIRVHLSSRGMPVAGDPVYGRLKDKKARGFRIDLARPALHAMRLAFTHPVTGERL